MYDKRRLFIVVFVLVILAGALILAVKYVQSTIGPDKHAAVKLIGDCATEPKRSGMEDSTNPELQKLAEYEVVCGGSFADSQMIFAPMPTSNEDAQSGAAAISRQLKELDHQLMKPIVVFEPANSQGFLNTVSTGTYTSILRTYYQKLKTLGITDHMMGTWVLFPEANTPAWDITDPDIFTRNVISVGNLQKEFFPQSNVSILLNNQTYPDNDTDWSSGTYASLLPYVTGLPKGLIDSFGYQGFPWAPPANESGIHSVLDARAFLRVDMAVVAADALDVKDIWLNTGTFGRSSTQSSDTLVIMDSNRRKKILDQVLMQAGRLQDKGFATSINIFAEDKSEDHEAVDWSYWQAGEPQESDATPVLTDFIATILKDGMRLSIYDTTDQ